MSLIQAPQTSNTLSESIVASGQTETDFKELGIVGLGVPGGILKKSISQLEEEIKENEDAIFLLEAERKKILDGEGQLESNAQVAIEKSFNAGEYVSGNVPVGNVLAAKQESSVALDNQEGSTEYLKVSPFLKVNSRRSSVSSLSGVSVRSFQESVDSNTKTCNGDSSVNYGINVVQPDQQPDVNGCERSDTDDRD